MEEKFTEVLIRQSFLGQEKKLEILEEENKELKERVKEQAEIIKTHEELFVAMDNKITQLEKQINGEV